MSGNVLVSTDNSIVMKGTFSFWPGGDDGPTAAKGKLNNNLLFSCCCARRSHLGLPFFLWLQLKSRADGSTKAAFACRITSPNLPCCQCTFCLIVTVICFSPPLQPNPMDVCISLTSACSLGGFALESRCHSGSPGVSSMPRTTQLKRSSKRF